MSISEPHQFGRYRLIEKLATGGMAQIYLARQEGIAGFDRPVVVKRILPHLAENADFVRMFLDEARIAARLSHPNIVQIHDLGQVDGSYFIAMEHVDGADVRRVWKQAEARGMRLPVPIVCRIVIGACEGLHYAHTKVDDEGQPLSIVHRDVSPQNILASFQGAVKVADFGIAKAANQATHTRSGVLKGKYSYMSPEQAQGKKLDKRSDVFALGVVLYELLTGIRLFKRENEILTLAAVIECKVAPPSSLRPEIPPELDSICHKALSFHADARYPDCRTLQLELEELLIRHQLASSSAHLAEFMRQIFGPEVIEPQPKPRGETTRDSRKSRSRGGGSSGEAAALAELEPRTVALEEVGGKTEPTELPEEFAHPGGRRKSDRLPTVPEGATRRVSVVELEAAAKTGLESHPRSPWPRRLVTGGLLVLAGALAYFLPLPHSTPAVPPTAPKPAAFSTVLIDSTPQGASIVIDGIARGKTPAALRLASTRAFALALDLEGHERLERTVESPAAGVAIRLAPFVLEPTPATAPAPEPEPSTAPRGASQPAVVRSEPVAVRAAASIVVVSDEPGRVLLGKRELGRTGELLRLPAGKHELTVRAELDGVRHDRPLRVELRSGEAAEERVAFQPGTIRFFVPPVGGAILGAEILYRGRRVAEIPGPPLRFPAGSHLFEVRNRELGFSTRKRVRVVAGQESKVSIEIRVQDR